MGVHEMRVRAVALHAYLELPLIVVGLRLGSLQHARVELRVLAEHPSIGQAELARPLDHEDERLAVRDDAMRGPLRKDEVIAGLESQRPVVRLQQAGTFVHEVAHVAVCIAQEIRHRLRAPRHEETGLVVPCEQRPGTARVGRIRRLHVAVDLDPRGRRMRPVQVRRAPVEGFAAVLFFERARGQTDVRLLRDLSARQGEHAYSVPRAACSRSIASKSALKLPRPKPREPWRWMISKKTVGRSTTGFVKICSRYPSSSRSARIA